MRRIIMLLLASAATLLAHATPSGHAAQDPTGRWTGTAHITGSDMALVVDLAKDKSGAWVGSMIIPGFDIKGAALGNLRMKGNDLSFDLGDALGAAPNNATFTAHLDEKAGMTGQFRQGGNIAPFTLKRTGAAQVEIERRSTAVSREAEGRWIGEYELGGYPRHVTVDIANHNGAAASVDFVIVGKATTRLPIDLIAEEEGMLRIESHAYRITFEGRVHGSEGRIAGTFENGPFETPLTLRREGKTS